MLDKLKNALTWQVVTLLVVGALVFGAIAIFAPEDTRMALFGAHGLFFTVLAWLTSTVGGSSTPPSSGT